MTGSIFTLIFSIGFPVFSSIKVISPVSGSTFFTKSDITSPVSLFINISSPVFGSFFVIIFVVLTLGSFLIEVFSRFSIISNIGLPVSWFVSYLLIFTGSPLSM